ncbi:MAG: adenylyl-sulfate kinase [Bacteroidota bacterium]|nr:adenylyl-sulfate kinase [Bacteroidota bacterium]
MPDSTNIVPQDYQVSKSDRQRLNQHASCIVWFTGLSGSGKSTLANGVEQQLFKKGIRTYVLDGDNIRFGLNNNVDFSKEGRKENIRRIGEVAKLFVDAGVVVLTAFISPYREDRDRVRKLVKSGEFVEVYVDCPLEICEERDVKGLYQKARKGEIPDFTGISSPFEAPLEPELTIATSETTITNAVEQITAFILNSISNKK